MTNTGAIMYHAFRKRTSITTWFFAVYYKLYFYMGVFSACSIFDGSRATQALREPNRKAGG